MKYSVQRYLLSGVALVPAFAAYLLPDPARDDIFSVFGLTGTLILWSVLAVSVIHIASYTGARPDTVRRAAPVSPGGLLRPEMLRQSGLALPDLSDMRGHLGAVLAAAETELAPGTPESRERATAIALSRILDTWNVPTLHALAPDRLRELYLLDRLLRARPDEAGALAQLFERPDVVLDIRDQIAAIGQRRKAFETQRDAYQATLDAWINQPSVPRPSALLLSLQALDRPDIDLWHKVVLHHDPFDPAQREAALWCVRQLSCDRATVAAYFAFLSADGHLEAAARRGETLWLNAVLSVIGNWNAGRYTTREIGLDPTDSVVSAAPVLSAALDRLADITQTPRWPDPQGLFAEYAGRAPRPRDNWCLRSGTITHAPDPNHYFERRPTQAA